jgi:hypothetical protein
MKAANRSKPKTLDSRTRKIVKALRDARKEAIKSARMHGVPITYLKNGKLIRERV